MQPAIERMKSLPNQAPWCYLMTLIPQIWGQWSNKRSRIDKGAVSGTPAGGGIRQERIWVGCTLKQGGIMGKSVMTGTCCQSNSDSTNLEYVGAATMDDVKYISWTQFGYVNGGCRLQPRGVGRSGGSQSICLVKVELVLEATNSNVWVV